MPTLISCTPGEQISDREISEEELAAIDYTNLVTSLVDMISDPIDVSVIFLGHPTLILQ